MEATIEFKLNGKPVSMTVDGTPVRSCQTPVADVQGKEVLTIEGLAGEDGTLHPLQKAFMEHDALQCGFCTPGMILRAVNLLQNNPQPSRTEIIQHMDQSFCRCGSHTRIVQAIESAARQMSGGAKP